MSLPTTQTGLFSAIVTAFIIEFYGGLQADPKGVSEQLLVHISAQLAEITVVLRDGNSANMNLTPAATLAIFDAPVAVVWINGLWFSSLVCSLISASLGTLVKQWLRRYIATDYSSPRERPRLWEYRYRGLIRWLTPNIIAFLPVLLRIALNLFFAGLIVLLYMVDCVIMIIIAAFVGWWALVYALMTILLFWYPACLYASPEAVAFYSIMHLAQTDLHQWKYIS